MNYHPNIYFIVIGNRSLCSAGNKELWLLRLHWAEWQKCLSWDQKMHEITKGGILWFIPHWIPQYLWILSSVFIYPTHSWILFFLCECSYSTFNNHCPQLFTCCGSIQESSLREHAEPTLFAGLHWILAFDSPFLFRILLKFDKQTHPLLPYKTTLAYTW